MSKRHQPRVEVYAVVRLDHYLPVATLEERITIKEIVPTLERAESEVARLTALVSDGGSTYFSQYTPGRARAARRTPGSSPPRRSADAGTERVLGW
jgi:hypothetical protein